MGILTFCVVYSRGLTLLSVYRRSPKSRSGFTLVHGTTGGLRRYWGRSRPTGRVYGFRSGTLMMRKTRGVPLSSEAFCKATGSSSMVLHYPTRFLKCLEQRFWGEFQPSLVLGLSWLLWLRRWHLQPWGRVNASWASNEFYKLADRSQERNPWKQIQC